MKRLGSILLAAAMAAGLLAACGKDDSATAQVESTPAPSSAAPVEEEDTYDPALLTGLEKGEDYPEGQRFVAVMVNNMSNTPYQQARPQAGLSDADVLVEIKVEGGITRFMALFTDYNAIPDIGPIRSARDQFFRLVLPWQPLYVHVGQSVVQTEYITNYSYDEWNLEGKYDSQLTFRDRDRVNWAGNSVATEHTAYTNGQLIADYVERHDVDDRRMYNSIFFDFVDYRDPAKVLTGEHLDGGASPDAGRVTIRHSQSYRTQFDYDSSLGQYAMAQYYSAKGSYMDTVDENNGQQLMFDNLLILFTDIHTYPGHEAKDLQYAEYSWGGVGYYCYGGKIERIRWQKGTPLDTLRIVDFNTQEPFEINCGKTYVTVVDEDEIPNFSWEPLETAQDVQEAPTTNDFVENED